MTWQYVLSGRPRTGIVSRPSMAASRKRRRVQARAKPPPAIAGAAAAAARTNDMRRLYAVLPAAANRGCLPDEAAQYDFAHTTRLGLGCPVNGQTPGSPGSSGMQRTVTPRSSLILASSAGSPLKCVIAKPPWIGV